MSVLENTISMLEVLPETDLIRIQDYTRSLIKQRGAKYPFPLLDEKDIIEIAKTSERQIANGECKNAKEFLSELRQEYGILSYSISGSPGTF